MYRFALTFPPKRSSGSVTMATYDGKLTQPWLKQTYCVTELTKKMMLTLTVWRADILFDFNNQYQ